MTVSDEQLAERLGVNLAKEGVALEVARVRAVSTTLLTSALAQAFREVPEDIHDECLLSVAKAVHDRKRTTNGVAGTTMDGAVPVRSPRDPLASIRPILAGYVVPL